MTLFRRHNDIIASCVRWDPDDLYATCLQHQYCHDIAPQYFTWYDQLGVAANFDNLVKFGNRCQIRRFQVFIKFAKMVEFPLPVPQIWRSQKQVAIQIKSSWWIRGQGGISVKNMHLICDIISTRCYKNSKLPHKLSLVQPRTFGNTICFYATTSSEKSTIEISTDMATKWVVTVANSVTAIKHTIWQ